MATACAHGAQITVDTVADNLQIDGKVSLREALLSAASKQDVNADVAAARQFDYDGAESIRFAIAVDAQTIAVAAPLPALAAGTHVDGSTQPGYVGQNLITVDGAQAGAAADGLVLLEASRITALDIVNFGGQGLRSDDDIVFAHGFDSAGVTDPALRDGFVPASVEQCASLDNGGDGLRVDAGTALSTSSLRVSRNHGVGVRVRGALAASQSVVTLNAGDGVVVDSADPVDLDQSNIQFNGQHPQLAPTVKAGLRVLRASRPDVVDELGLLVTRGGLFVHGSGTIANHLGDGVIVGDAQLQTGVIQASIGDLQIHHNLTGIRVAQRDSDAHRTAIGILANNIYQNAAAGMRIATSYMYATYGPDRRVISSNDVHHNAVTPQDQCSAAVATQAQSQVVFDGPVAATPVEVAACQPPEVDTQAECAALSDPNNILSNGVNNHCVWTGSACTVAWDMGGRAGVQECDSSRNRIFAYVNDPGAADASTQKGVAAFNGAIVRARRNVWGIGGAGNALFEDSGSFTRIDNNDDCGNISTCP